MPKKKGRSSQKQQVRGNVKICGEQRDLHGISDGKEFTCNVGVLGSVLGQEDSQELLTLVFLPGEFLGQKSLVGYSPWGRKE